MMTPSIRSTTSSPGQCHELWAELAIRVISQFGEESTKVLTL